MQPLVRAAISRLSTFARFSYQKETANWFEEINARSEDQRES